MRHVSSPFEWLYLVEVLGTRLAVDTRDGSPVSLPDDLWSTLAAGEPVRGAAAAAVAAAVPWAQGSDHAPVRPPEADAADPPALKSLELNVTRACNLRCAYCYRRWPGRRAESMRGPRMSRASAFRAVDLVLGASEGVITLSFMGGEPLLEWGLVRDTVLHAVRRAAGRRVQFEITTNGTLLCEEIQAFLVAHDVEVEVSLDGPPGAHDALRPFADGSPSSGPALKHALGLRRRIEQAGPGTRASLTIRGTLFRPTLDPEPALYFLADQGFDSISLAYGAMPDGHPLAIRADDLPSIRSRCEHLALRLADDLTSGRRTFRYLQLSRILESAGLGPRRIRQCGAGSGHASVATDGRLYPCARFVGISSMCIGDVGQGIRAPDIGRHLWRATVDTKDPCRLCWARYLCGGGCHADAYIIGGSVERPHPLLCAVQRQLATLGLYVLHRLRTESPSRLQDLIPGWLEHSYRPRRHRDVRSVARDQRIVLYDPRTKHVRELDEVSRSLWERCDAATPWRVLARDVARSCGVADEHALDGARRTILEWRRLGLLDDGETPVCQQPAGKVGV